MITAVCPNCFEEFERRGSSKGRQPYCPPCKEESMARIRENDRIKRKAKRNEGASAFSSLANRVGEGLNKDMDALCRNSVTPDIWYSDEPTTIKEDTKLKELEAFVAIKTCNECPIQKQCLDYAMTDGDAIKYGIWGGTFAFERLGKTSFSGKSNAYTYQYKLRKKFKQKGYDCPPIPTNHRANTASMATLKRREKVQELLNLNYTRAEIADALNVATGTIYHDLNYLSGLSGAQS